MRTVEEIKIEIEAQKLKLVKIDVLIENVAKTVNDKKALKVKHTAIRHIIKSLEWVLNEPV